MSVIAGESTQREEVGHMVTTMLSARLRSAAWAQPTAVLAHGTRVSVVDALAAQAAVAAPPPRGAPPV